MERGKSRSHGSLFWPRHRLIESVCQGDDSAAYEASHVSSWQWLDSLIPIVKPSYHKRNMCLDVGGTIKIEMFQDKGMGLSDVTITL